MNFFSGKKILLLGVLLILIIGIPLTLSLLGQQQTTESQAEKSTKLYFTKPGEAIEIDKLQVKNGDTFSMDIWMNPGTNQVIATTLHITFEGAKLEKAESGLEMAPADIQQGFTTVMQPAQYTTGSVTMTIGVGTDPTKIIKSSTKIAKITFKALSETGATPTRVDFGVETTVVSSVDQEINVLSTKTPVDITIGAGTNITPTASPSATLVPNQLPVCTGLTADRATSGTAPHAITFTATGNDPDGTLSKVTFNFGDSPTEDVPNGTPGKTMSTPKTHTYNNAGAFTTTAVFTDNAGGVSLPAASCTVTVNITAKATTGGGGVGAPVAVEPTATDSGTKGGVEPTTEPVVTPELKPGPGDVILGAGAFGVVLSIIGAVLFFAL